MNKLNLVTIIFTLMVTLSFSNPYCNEDNNQTDAAFSSPPATEYPTPVSLWFSYCTELYVGMCRDEFRYICGGTLITDSLVLTSARCFNVDNNRKVKARHREHWKVKLGNIGGENITCGIRQAFIPTEYTMNPIYAGIALLLINCHGVQLDHVKTVTINSNSLYPLPNQVLTSINKQIENEPIANIMRAKPDAICRAYYLYSTNQSSDSQGFGPASFCAHRDGENCNAYAGNPLLGYDQDGRAVAMGIYSHGIGCGYAFGPDMFVRLSYFREWIEEVMRFYGTVNTFCGENE